MVSLALALVGLLVGVIAEGIATDRSLSVDSHAARADPRGRHRHGVVVRRHAACS